MIKKWCWFGLFPFAAVAQVSLLSSLELGTGALSGYIQTPKGGTIGTTSLERPSFQELNQHHDQFFQTSLGLQVDRYLIEFNFLYCHPQAQGTLNTPLMTHAQFIPEQSPFLMQVQLDWSLLGVGVIFDHWNTCIIPRIEGNWLHYTYDFSAPHAQSQRAFSPIAAGIGLDLMKTLSPQWTMFAQIKCNLPLSNFHYSKVDVGISYLLWQQGGVFVSPYLKCGFLALDYEDDQPVSNHIRYTNFPWISLGFSLQIDSPLFIP